MTNLRSPAAALPEGKQRARNVLLNARMLVLLVMAASWLPPIGDCPPAAEAVELFGFSKKAPAEEIDEQPVVATAGTPGVAGMPVSAGKMVRSGLLGTAVMVPAGLLLVLSAPPIALVLGGLGLLGFIYPVFGVAMAVLGVGALGWLVGLTAAAWGAQALVGSVLAAPARFRGHFLAAMAVPMGVALVMAAGVGLAGGAETLGALGASMLLFWSGGSTTWMGWFAAAGLGALGLAGLGATVVIPVLLLAGGQAAGLGSIALLARQIGEQEGRGL